MINLERSDFIKVRPLIHTPTRRPVIVGEVNDSGFVVYTIDDTFIYKGKVTGGCLWRMTWDYAKYFEAVE